jgi:hypothetical protein
MVGSAFETFRGSNTFDASGNVYRWIMSNRLNGAAQKTKTNPESHLTKMKISILDGCLRTAFRLLGAGNYQYLLYYLQENSTFSRPLIILEL